MANLRKYALETSPVADCENMHSAKIILSPYSYSLVHRAHTIQYEDRYDIRYIPYITRDSADQYTVINNHDTSNL